METLRVYRTPILTLDPDAKAGGGMVEVVKAADAQATIAALQGQLDAARRALDSVRTERDNMGDLCDQYENERDAAQARVKELEALKTPDDAFTYCTYCGEKSAIDEHNEDLTAHIKVCPKHPMRTVEADLARVTAELVGTTHNVNVYQSLYSTGCMDRALLENDLRELRTLIAALPLVEGEITCSQQFDSAWRMQYWQVEAYGVADECVYRLSNLREEEAKAYAALLQHRQGMEGQHG